jgi:signal transduction histidine kinase/CheY-like chemotaxis protein/HPt (histidine-containing phosphotransfer) domain-containing protein
VVAPATVLCVLGWLTLATRTGAGVLNPFLGVIVLGLLAPGCMLAMAISFARTKSLERENAQLIRAIRQAKESSFAKSEYVAVLSHEIRTPLNAILGLLELANDARAAADREMYLEDARNAAHSLSRLVGDVLDFAKIESGHLSLDAVEFSVRSLVVEVIRTLESGAKKKNLQLVWKVEPQAPEFVIGDADRLRQVLLNLAGNAIKFTDQGKVSLEIQCAQMESDFIALRFIVQDTGKGIPASDLESIHEELGTSSRSSAGNGLGLAISSRFVRLMGGAIQVSSEVNRGTTFDFTLRFRSSTPSTLETHTRASLTPRRILLAEDNELNALVAAEILRQEGHIVTVAGSGPQALDEFAAQSFDLVLMDLGIPGLDGMQTAASIRKSAHEANRRIPIVGLSAHASLEIRTVCLSSGMDGFISKPFRKEDLLAVIDRVCASICSESCSGIPRVLDQEHILAQVGGDRALLERMVRRFRQQNEIIFARIRDSLAEEHPESIQAEIHRLLGSLSHWGEGEAYRLASAMEERRSQHDFHAMKAGCSALEEAVRRLEDELIALQETVR